jgi:DNA helicase HerA-like ATPase
MSAREVSSAIEVLLRSRKGNGIRFSRGRILAPRWRRWFAVSEDELVCILPDPDAAAGSVEARARDSLPTLPLGRTPTGRVVGPRIEPDQGRHMTVLGETGMGKSSTLIAIARKASNLGGVILFDPLGETARSFVAGLSAEGRSRLVEVSPRQVGCSINALEGIGPDEGDPIPSDRRLNDLVHALRRVRSGRHSDSSYWGPRLEEMLTRSVRAAAGFPNGTLADAHTLLATGGRTRQVTPPSTQDDVRELSNRIRERPDDAEGARRLLYEVVRSPVLLRMLCERNPELHTKNLVDDGRIVVISGDAASVGESVARYLLAVYLALVWSELLARPSNPKTFVVLDESQWFSHESLAEMLRLARRKNVHVVIATQTVGSLPDSVAEAVWTNVSDFVAFRGSPEEARELSRATHGISVEEVLSLPRGHAAVLLGKGNSVDWLRTAGRPPGSVTSSGGADAIGSASRFREPKVPAEASLVSADGVLTWIRDRSRALPIGELLRVELDELRRTIDPSGRAVRDAGSLLGRAGAIVASERSVSGPVWVLDPTRIPGGSGSTNPSLPSAGTKDPQPS